MRDKKNLLIYAHYYSPDIASTGQILKELAEGMLELFHITVMLMWNLTWLAFSISWKPAAIVRVWSIWCTLLLPVSTEATRKCRTVPMTR